MLIVLSVVKVTVLLSHFSGAAFFAYQWRARRYLIVDIILSNTLNFLPLVFVGHQKVKSRV